jgi:hypothetical protein
MHSDRSCSAASGSYAQLTIEHPVTGKNLPCKNICKSQSVWQLWPLMPEWFAQATSMLEQKLRMKPAESIAW